MGVLHLKKTRPGVGWIRSPEKIDEALKDELLRLRREIDSLQDELIAARRRMSPAGTDDLAQGIDSVSILIEFGEADPRTYKVTWEEVIRSVLPQTFGAGADNRVIANALSSLAREKVKTQGGPTNRYWGAAATLKEFVWLSNESNGGTGAGRGRSEFSNHRNALECDSLWSPGRIQTSRDKTRYRLGPLRIRA